MVSHASEAVKTPRPLLRRPGHGARRVSVCSRPHATSQSATRRGSARVARVPYCPFPHRERAQTTEVRACAGRLAPGARHGGAAHETQVKRERGVQNESGLIFCGILMLVRRLLWPLLSLSAPLRRGGPAMSTSDGGDDPDMAALASRLQDLKEGFFDCKILCLPTPLVPGQRMATTAPPEMVRLFAVRSSRPIIVIGKQGAKLDKVGVEVRLEGRPIPVPVVPNIHPQGTADIVLVASRLCEIVEYDDGVGLNRAGRGQWCDFDQATGAPDEATLERSAALGPLVDRWLELVRRSGRERVMGHVDAVVAQLGAMPDVERCHERALWVAGLINPLPAFGVSSAPTTAARGSGAAARGATVAPEIRSAALTASSADARLRTVDRALRESLRRLEAIVDDGPQP